MAVPAPRPRARGLLGLLGSLGSALLVAGCGSTGGAAAPGTSSSSGSGGSGGGRLDVVASTDVWGSIASTVGGDAVRVTSFIDDPDQDPHSYEANARNQLTVADADVLVENGGGYDDFMHTLRKAARSRATVLDAVQISGRTAPAGGDLNEHVWYDVPTVAKVADALASALGRADPARAATFTANADALTAQLRAVEADEASVAATASGTGVAITEPVPLYLLTACGLVDRTPAAFSRAVEEGTDVPPTVLSDTEALFTDHAVAALVYNEQTTGAETEAVLSAARASGVAVVPVTETLPRGQDYVQWMRANLAAVRAAVAG